MGGASTIPVPVPEMRMLLYIVTCTFRQKLGCEIDLYEIGEASCSSPVTHRGRSLEGKKQTPRMPTTRCKQ